MTLDGEGKVVSKRFYWDQATVLKQANVLPNSLFCRSNNSEVVLPVCDMNKMNVLDLFPTGSRIEQAVVQENVAPVSRQGGYNIFNQAPEEFRPSSRVLSRPGGNTHDIFNNDEPIRPSGKRINQNAPTGNLNLYDDSPVEFAASNRRDPNWSQPPEEQRYGRRQSSAGLDSAATHFKVGEQEDVPFELHSGKKLGGNYNQSHFQLSGEQENEMLQPHSGKRLGQNVNQSHFQLSGEQDEMNLPVHGKKHSESYGNTSHFSLTEDVERVTINPNGRRNPNAETLPPAPRPSSR